MKVYMMQEGAVVTLSGGGTGEKMVMITWVVFSSAKTQV